MKRPPATLWLFALSGAILGAMLALDGLHARLWGDFLFSGAGAGLWARFLGLDAGTLTGLAWPMIVVGCAWWGVVSGVFLRQSWARRLTPWFGLVSLLYLGPGTALAALALLALLAPSSRRWLEADADDG